MTTQAEERKPERRGIMPSLTGLSVRYVERLMPDPYLFAVILTIVVAALVAFLVKDASATGMLKAWYGGVWGSQKHLHVRVPDGAHPRDGLHPRRGADPQARHRLYREQAEQSGSGRSALLRCERGTAPSELGGLGLVAGALVARQIAKRLPDTHFGYLIAASFMGFIVWTQGLSSSIALANTDSSSPINVIHKIAGITVPLSQTIFQPYSWLSVIVVLAVLAVAVWRMAPAETLAPRPGDLRRRTPAGNPDRGQEDLRRMAREPVDPQRIGVRCRHRLLLDQRLRLNIASMIMLLTITSALLHKTPIRFIRAFTDAAKVSGPPCCCSTRSTADWSACWVIKRPKTSSRCRRCWPRASCTARRNTPCRS